MCCLGPSKLHSTNFTLIPSPCWPLHVLDETSETQTYACSHQAQRLWLQLHMFAPSTTSLATATYVVFLLADESHELHDEGDVVESRGLVLVEAGRAEHQGRAHAVNRGEHHVHHVDDTAQPPAAKEDRRVEGARWSEVRKVRGGWL